MDKAKELKQQFIFDWQPSDQQKSIHNQNFQFELNRLLNEVSREKAIEFYKWMCSDMGIRLGQHVDLSDEEWYDDWKSKQEEREHNSAKKSLRR